MITEIFFRERMNLLTLFLDLLKFEIHQHAPWSYPQPPQVSKQYQVEPLSTKSESRTLVLFLSLESLGIVFHLMEVSLSVMVEDSHTALHLDLTFHHTSTFKHTTMAVHRSLALFNTRQLVSLEALLRLEMSTCHLNPHVRCPSQYIASFSYLLYSFIDLQYFQTVHLLLAYC